MEKLTDCYIIFHRPLGYEIWDDEIWTPLQAGTDINGPILANGRRDNEGQDNISAWNALYCENSALYWIWKNLTGAKYAGMIQYRRRFNLRSILDLDKAFEEHDLITEQPLHLSITVRQQYSLCHNNADMDLCRAAVKYLYPDYGDDWDKCIESGNTLHYSNGFIMREDDFAKYCEWLFSILTAMKAEMDFKTPEDHKAWIATEMQEGRRPKNNGKGGIEGAEHYQGEIFGFLSERLFTLYVFHNFDDARILRLPYLKMEPGI